MTFILYHLAESVVFEHHLGNLAASCSVCACGGCSFAEYPVFLPCLWILRLAGCCTLLEEARRPKQNRRRSCIVAKSERQVDGVRVDSDIEALPKSALDNLVSKRRFTDGQKVLGTQDKRRSIQTCSRVQSGHRNFAGKWDSLHPTTCCVQRATCFVW